MSHRQQPSIKTGLHGCQLFESTRVWPLGMKATLTILLILYCCYTRTAASTDRHDDADPLSSRLTILDNRKKSKNLQSDFLFLFCFFLKFGGTQNQAGLTIPCLHTNRKIWRMASSKRKRVLEKHQAKRNETSINCSCNDDEIYLLTFRLKQSSTKVQPSRIAKRQESRKNRYGIRKQNKYKLMTYLGCQGWSDPDCRPAKCQCPTTMKNSIKKQKQTSISKTSRKKEWNEYQLKLQRWWHLPPYVSFETVVNKSGT